MKKLLTICLFIATVFTINAQQKPTKEQTVAFIKRTCESTRLKKHWDNTIMQTSFNYDNSSIEYLTDGNTSNTIDEYSLIKWENFTRFGIGTSENDITQVFIEFSNTVKLVRDGKLCDFDKLGLRLYVPNSKVESIKKAIERLVEIAKEENKDPFQN